jgi:AraC-like DNA-binding protein
MAIMFGGGDTAASPGKTSSRRDAGFASARITTYRLFGLLELNMFEIMPHTDIEIPFEFSGDVFEIAYALDGSFSICTDSTGEEAFSARDLYLSPGFGARGREIYRGGQLFKTISFNAPPGAEAAILDKLGWGELWDEAVRRGRRKQRGARHIAPAPPDIARSFLQIAACNYPDRCKRLFFESKFMEIVSRLIAGELPHSGSGEFENSRIRRIPGLLMERSDALPSIPELARELSLNATAMKLGFKRMFGEPIYAHHRGARLELAAGMLLDTDKSIFEISMDAGYSNCGNFCRAFKKRFNASPKQYRMASGAASPPFKIPI